MINNETEKKLKKIVEEINNKYEIDLRSILLRSEEIGYKSIYIYLYLLAEEIFKLNPECITCYEPGKSCITDLRILVDSLNIEIVEMYMKDMSKFRFALLGYVDTYDFKPRQYTTTFYLNKETSDLTKRYFMAKGLSYCIIEWIKNGDIPNGWLFYEPEFLKYTEDQLTNILSSFLLMRIDNVLDIMLEYIQTLKESGDYYALMRRFNYLMGVTDYHGVICLQDIRYLVEILYNYNGELKLLICEKIRSEKYRELIK